MHNMDIGKDLISKLISSYNSVGAGGTESANEINKIKDSVNKTEVSEKWSEKYKKSIDCNNPKGFSQRAHCQGKKKKLKESLTESERTTMAKLRDIAKKHACKDTKNCTAKDKIESVYQELKKQYQMGVKVEKEHKSADPKLIALDHLSEDPKYYTKLKKMESNESTGSGSSGSFSGPIAFADSQFLRNSLKEKPKKVEAKEATGSGSSGSYEGPAFGAKSMSPKDWRGAAKPQIPGGKFVTVKKKCKTFPYCNQGDINALNLTESKLFEDITNRISMKYDVDVDMVKKIIINDINKRQD